MSIRLSKVIKFSAMVMMTAVLASCATSETTDYMKTQVIDIQRTDWEDAKAKIPPTAVIQPADLVTSPIIDIRTLRAETERKTATVRSSTLEQEKQKEDIKNAVEKDPLASTELTEEYVSDEKMDDEKGKEGELMTSGKLASQAASDSFVFIDSADAFRGAIAEYDYIEGMIYEVITSPNAITDIRLKPGESIASAPIVNDGGASWQFTVGTSIENGVTVQHLFVKPAIVGLDTSMIILTNQRTYYFRIASFPQSYMTALRFRYPEQMPDGNYINEEFKEFIENSRNSEAEIDAFTVDLNSVDYGYEIKVKKGRPAWTPQLAFSTDTKTFIQLPPSVTTSSDMPSVYVVRDKTESLVNWRIKGNMYQLDTVITPNEYIILKSGDNEQVRIEKN